MVTMRRVVVLHTHPFVGFTGVVQSEIVVDRLRRQHGGQAFGQRLQAVEGTVASDGNQSFNAELLQTRREEINLVLIISIHVITRRTDERSALRRIELRDSLEKRIQVHVRHTRIEEAIKALDESVDFNFQLVRAHHCAMNRGVERRRVASCG